MGANVDNPIIEAARSYAGRGWHVLPVRGKKPQGEAWQLKATVVEVACAFGSHQFDGVGVLLGCKSGIVDIECDSEEAEQTLFELLGGEVPNTPTFRSTRGKHYLFRWPASVQLPSLNVFKVKGLEFRTGNGAAAQSVFPPSPGRTWEIGPETPLADFPAWDRALSLWQQSQKPKNPQPDCRPLPIYQSGDERLDVPKWLAKHGRQVLDWTITPDGATRWYIECPGIDAHTTPNNVRDCCVTQDQQGALGGCCFHQSCGMASWSNLKDAIGGLEWSDFHDELPAENLPAVDISAIETALPAERKPRTKKTTTAKPNFDGSAPDFNVPGFVNEVIDYTLATTPYPNRALAFCGALALLSVVVARKVRCRNGLRPNIYLLALAHSAMGKDGPRKTNSRILEQAGMLDVLGGRIAADRGLRIFYMPPQTLQRSSKLTNSIRS